MEYLWQNPEDELEAVLKGKEWDSIAKAWGGATGSCVVHHIYSGAMGGKYDIWPLIITVDAVSHDFCHKYSKLGLIACVWAKLVRNKEFDRELVKKVTGRDLINIIVSWREMMYVEDPYYLGLIDDIESHADTPPSRPLPFTELEEPLGEEGEGEQEAASGGSDGDG